MKKKILFTHFSLKNGERWGRTFHLANGLDRDLYDVYLITAIHSFNIFKIVKEVDNNVIIYTFPDIVPSRILSKGFGLISLVYKLCFSFFNKFDFVYSDAGETPVCGFPCKINQWLYKAKYISEWSDMLGKGGHYDSKSKTFKLLFGWYYLWAVIYFRRSADFVVVLTEYMKNFAVNIGITSDKIIIVPGGSMVRYIQYYSPSSTKNLLGILKSEITIGYIGVSSREIDDFLPVLNYLKDNHKKLNVKVVLFGHKIPDMDLLQLGFNDFVIQCGWIDFKNDSALLAAIDVFLLIKPNNIISNAGWPNKLGDYLAVGRPVIVTPYGDIKEFVSNNPEGFFILKSIDDNNLATIFSRIKSDSELAIEMGRFNRNIAIHEVSWEARARILSDKIA